MYRSALHTVDSSMLQEFKEKNEKSLLSMQLLSCYKWHMQ